MQKKIQKILDIAFVIVFALSLNQVYFNTQFDTYRFEDLKLIIVIALFVLFYLPFRKAKKKKVIEIYDTMIVVLYFLTFNVLYSGFCQDNYAIAFLWIKEPIITFILFASYFLYLTISKNKKGFEFFKIARFTLYVLSIFIAISLAVDKVISFDVGLYLFTASMFILMIKMVIPNEKILEEPHIKMIEKPIDVFDSFLIINYLKGLPKDYDLKDNTGVIMNRKKKRELYIAVYNSSDPIRIRYHQIEKIELQKADYNRPKKRKKEVMKKEELYVLSGILNIISAEAASENLAEAIHEYAQLNPSEVTNLTITYTIEKETKELQLYTKLNTSPMIDQIEKESLMPIERI